MNGQMGRTLGKMCMTIVAMLLVFLGIRGFLADSFPVANTGWFEIGAYVASVIYGLVFYDWLGRVIGRKSNG